MSPLLALSDDELALLRFTCDLFFVEESPLWAFEAEQREPVDYAGSYQALVDRGIIDAHGFRITDDALNRIAPVTECDARILHLISGEDGRVTQEDHWLLDEIAVHYERVGDGADVRHVFGPDLDPDALVQRLARHLVPRRAGGESFDAVLSPAEVLATSLLLAAADARGRRTLADDEVRDILARVPADDVVLPGMGLLAITKQREPRVDATLKGLFEKRVLLRDALGTRLHASLFALRGFQGRRRHTIVRTDFREDDWLVREVTLLPVEGSLFVIAPVRGGFRLAELDGAALKSVLQEATAPQRAPERTREPQRLAALLTGPRRA